MYIRAYVADVIALHVMHPDRLEIRAEPSACLAFLAASVQLRVQQEGRGDDPRVAREDVPLLRAPCHHNLPVPGDPLQTR